MYQSYYSLLLVALKARILQAVPEILLVEQDFGQLVNYNTIPSIPWPCLLIDFTPSDFTNESQYVQFGDVTVQLRLAYPPVTPPDSISGKAIELYEIEAKLFKALQGWQPTDESGNAIGEPLMRLRASTEIPIDDDVRGIRVRSILFTTGFEDDSAMPVNSIATPDFDVDYLDSNGNI
jgi:hypothetical protein